jgi:hypothetical protein
LNDKIAGCFAGAASYRPRRITLPTSKRKSAPPRQIAVMRYFDFADSGEDAGICVPRHSRVPKRRGGVLKPAARFPQVFTMLAADLACIAAPSALRQ